MIGGLLRGLYRRTIGSRRNLRTSLNRLTVGNPVTHVEALFGVPVLIETHPGRMPVVQGEDAGDGLAWSRVDLEWRLYDARHGWLTGHFLNDRLVGFGFTLTDRRFRFNLIRSSFDQMDGVLGQSTYEQLRSEPAEDSYTLPGYASAIGYYAERWYQGNPGQYHHFGLATTSLGWGGFGNPETIEGVATGDFTDRHRPSILSPGEDSELRTYRRSHTPNTFSIIGPFETYPHLDDAYLHATAVVNDNTMIRFTDGPKGWRLRGDRRTIWKLLEGCKQPIRRIQG